MSVDVDADLASAWLDDDEASSSPSSGREMSPAEAMQRLASGDATVVDLRTSYQFASMRVPGSVNVPAGVPGQTGLLFSFCESFEKEAKKHVPLDTHVILICNVGVISRVAADRLMEAGYETVDVVRGGLEAWTLEESLPLEESDDREQTSPPELVEWPSDAPLQPCLSLFDPEEDEEDAEELKRLDMDLAALDALDEMPEDSDDDEVVQALGALLGGKEGGGNKADARNTVAPSPPRSLLNEEEVDASLAELAAELEAPVHPQMQSGSTMAPPIPQGGLPYGSTSSIPRSSSSLLANKRKRRERGGLPPAWLVDISKLDLEQMLQEGTLATLSVKELKTFLYEKEEALGGVKAALVERVAEVLTRTGAREEEGVAAPSKPYANGTSRAEAAKQAAASADDDDDDDDDLSLFKENGGDEANVRDDIMVDEVFSAM